MDQGHGIGSFEPPRRGCSKSRFQGESVRVSLWSTEYASKIKAKTRGLGLFFCLVCSECFQADY